MRHPAAVGLVAAALMLTTAAQALAAGDGTFTLADDSPFTAGSTPDALGVFDFSGDGDPDLVATNRDSSDLTILSGGDGAGFTASQLGILPPDAAPQDVSVGDFNGDSRPDFVVSNPGATPNSITVFLVTPAQITPATVNVLQRPSKFAIADFDGDGDQDIAVTTPSNERFAVLTNNGSGAFTVASTDNSVGDAATSIATGDFNADGDPDLVVTNSLDNRVTIRPGSAGATFSGAPTTTASVGTSPSDVAVADFNGDGDPDLAVTNSGSDDVTILTGQAGAGFAAAGTLPVGDAPSSVIATDLNGDGDPDLAVTNQTPGAETGSLSILLGASEATFTEAPGSPISVGAEPLGAVAGDFNADGAVDLATANGGSDNISVLLGNLQPGGGGGGDTTAPETTIDKGPSGPTEKTKAKIRYSASEAATFECKLAGKHVNPDLGSFQPCGGAKIKYKHLQRGKKKFFVRATDAAGNTDPTPAKLKWKVLN